MDELRIGLSWPDVTPASGPVAPFITTQPTNLVVNAGSNGTFSVVAGGTLPLSYQWYFNTNTPLSGVTNASFTITNAQTNNAGSYFVVITNAYGAVTSSVATLTVTNPLPLQIFCPSNITVSANSGCSATNVNLGTPVVTNVCGTATITSNAPTSFPVGTNNFVTWTVTDTCGNSNTCTQQVIVRDTNAPSITCPANISTTNSAGTNVALNVVLGTPVTGDNCAVASVSSNAPVKYPFGTNFVTWTVVDVNGNTNTCQQQVVVTSNLPPAITCPAGITSYVEASSCVVTGLNLGTPTVTFAGCGGVVLSSNAPPGFGVGTNTVTWTATDQCGRQTTCQQTVVIRDTNAPVFTSCPLSVTHTNDPGSCGKSNVTFSVGAADNCSVTVTQLSGLPSGSNFPVGVTTNRFLATDPSGNTNTCTFTVTVLDKQPPSIVCPATVVVTNNPGTNVATGVVLGMPTASELCGGYTLVSNAPSFYPSGTTIVTWTATDTAGNSTNCQQLVIVTNVLSPLITCPSNITVAANSGCFATNVNLGTATATQGCGGLVISSNLPPNFNVGTNLVTWSVVDACGRSNNCTQQIIVVDVTPPAVTTNQGANITIECPTAPSFSAPTFVDACNGTLLPTVLTTTNTVGCSNIITRTWTATDTSGNSTNRQQVITVRDITPPNVTTNQGADATIECPAVPAFTAPTFVDACAGTITPTVVTATNTVGCSNIVTRTWTANDGCGNVTNRSQTITVRDTTAPAVTTNQGANIMIECPTAPTFTAPIFVDACAGTITPTVSTVTNTVGTSNLVTRTWTANDGCGNVTNRSQTITIRDTTAPAVTTNQGANLTIECPTAPSFSTPTFVDACNGTITPSVLTTTNTVGCSNIITRTWTATDTSGNTTNRSQIITVRDTTAPAVTVSQGANATIECPAVPNFSAPTFVDACAGTITPTVLTVTNVVGASNLVTRTWTANDGCGNTTNRSQTITVRDTTPPSISCPPTVVVTNNPGTNIATGVVLGTPAFSDLCGGANLTSNAPPFYPSGTTIVTWTATDTAGNSTNCQQLVIVTNAVPPSLTCPADVTVSAGTNCLAAGVSLGTPTITFSGCGNVVITSNAPAGFPPGTNLVTWTATDQCGRSSTCQQRVVVRDTTPPVITCPSNITVNAALGQCTSNVNFAVSASDVCNGSVPVTSVPTNRFAFPVGITTVTNTATDASGNASTCTFTVTVLDKQSPTIACVPNLVFTNDAGSCFKSNVTFNVTGADNCSVTVTQTAGLVSGSNFPVGVTTNRFLVSDPSGNTNGCFFTVTVRDVQPPVINCPGNLAFSNDFGSCVKSNVTFTVPATDDCSVTVTQTTGLPSGSNFPVGVTTNRFVATDASGNTNVCSFTVTVSDREPPRLTSPGNITVNAAPGQCYTNVTFFVPTIDFCSGVSSLVSVPASGSQFSVGTTTVTSTAVDAAGNSNFITFTVTVRDLQPPTITCPGNITVNATTGQCTSNVTFTVNAADNCGISNIVSTPPSGYAFPVGTTVVTNVVRDLSGNTNTSPCTFTVTVLDRQLPTIACPPNLSVTNDPGSNIATGVVLGAPVANDNCGVLWVSNNAPAFYHISTNIVTWTVMDVNGNSNTCQQRVFVGSPLPPALECPPDLVVSANAACVATAVNLPTPAVTDLGCGGYTITSNAPAVFVLGTNLVTWRITDQCGQTNACVQLVIVRDTTPPVIVNPTNLVVDAGFGECASNVTFIVAATDNCTNVVSLVTTPPSGSTFGMGVTTVTNTAVDAAGNLAVTTFTVTVRDKTPPVVTAPTDMTVDAPSNQCGAVVNFSVSAVDVCGIITNLTTSVPTNGHVFPLGSTSVAVTAYDDSGNTTTRLFAVTVRDVTPPVVTCPPNFRVDAAPGQCTSNLNFSVTATDFCGAVTSISSSVPTNGYAFPVGVTTVTNTARDTSGNIGTCTFTVTVLDTQPPVISSPTNLVFDAPANQCSLVVFYSPTAADNCGGLVPVTSTPASGYNFPVGTTTVTNRAVDASGNAVTNSFAVTLRDVTPPAVTPLGDLAFDAAPGQCGIVVNFSVANGFDICDGSVPVTSTPTNRSFFPVGVTTVTNTAVDSRGNRTNFYFTVTVRDITPPLISGSSNLTVNAAAGQCSASVNFFVSATDACTNVASLTSSVPTNGNVFPLGITTVTNRAVDANGNASTNTFTVTVRDVTPPVIFCPGDMVVTANSGCVATNVYFGQPTVSDSCSAVSLSNDAPKGDNLNPVAWWKGDGNVLDVVGGNHGTNINNVSFANGVVGQAMVFNRSNGVVVGNPASLRLQNFSIDAWVKRTDPTRVALPQWGGAILVGYSTGGYALSMNQSGALALSKIYNGSSVAVTGRNITDTNYHHVAVTKSGSTVVFYIDGVAYPASGPLNEVFTFNTPLAIGIAGDKIQIPQDGFWGEIDEPAIYTNILSAAQIQALYAAGAAGKCGTPTPPTMCSIATFPLGTNVVTWTVTDGSGNTNSCIQRVTVRDVSPPAVTAAQGADTVIECPATPAFTAPVFTDSCTGTTIVTTVTLTNSTACSNVFTRTWTATDASGNSTNRTQIITVRDTTPPVISCPSNIAVTTFSQVPAPDTNTVVATDNCGVPVRSFVGETAVTNMPLVTITRTYTATDTCGKSASCTQTITVDVGVPTTATTLTDLTRCPDASAEFSTVASGTGPFSYEWRRNGVLLGSTSNRLTLAAVSAADAGSYTVKVAGLLNAVTNSATLTVLTNLSASGPTNRTVCVGEAAIFSVLAAGSGPFSYQWFKSFAPLPGETNSTLTLTNVSAPDVGSYAVVVNGACGSVSNSATLAVDPLVAVVTAPVSVTNCVGSDVGFSVVAAGAGLNYRWRFNGTVVGVSAALSLTNIQLTAAGDYEVVVSGVCGGAITNHATLTVTPLPGIVCSSNRVVELGSGWDFDTPVANYPLAVVGTVTNPACGQTMTVIRTWQALDACGNASICTQAVTVVDTIRPVITCPTNLVVEANPGRCSRSNVIFSVSASDNGAAASVTSIPASGSTFLVGVTTVNCLATDACGNTNACSFTVTVRDTQLPTISCPGDLVLTNDSGHCTRSNVIFTVSARDNCSVTLSQLSGLASGATFPPGVTTNRFRATDTSGNTDTCSFTVTIVDAEPPQISCPANRFFDTDPGTLSVTNANLGQPAVSDNCSVVTVTNDAPAVLPVGTNTITWTARDAAGLSATCQQQVVVRLNCSGVLDVSPLAGQTLCPGAPALFEVTASSPEPIGFSWWFNGQLLSGRTNRTLLISSVTASNAGVYQLVASTACFVVTNTATLVVLPEQTVSPASFLAAGGININSFGTASPYGSVIVPQCLAGTVKDITVTLFGFAHVFPADVSVLLVSPDGRGVKLMSGAGGAGTISPGVDLQFSDAATNLPPLFDLIPAGAYHPSDYLPDVEFPAPASPAPYTTNLSTFNGINPNGPWKLFVYDNEPGAGGSISNWGLSINWRDPALYLRNPRLLANDSFRAEIWGRTGVLTVVERSGDFTNWIPVHTNIYSTNPGVFIDTQFPPFPRRFYRAVQP